MKQIGINLHPQKIEQSSMKICNIHSQNNESVFSSDSKTFGLKHENMTATNAQSFPFCSGIPSIIEKINLLVLKLFESAANIFIKSKDSNLSLADENKCKNELNIPKFKTQSKETSSKQLRIAVIDDFNTQVSDCGNLKHGDIVTNVIKTQLPDAKIEKKNIHRFSESLQAIVDNVKRGIHYDAVNLSCTYNFSVKLDEIEVFDENNKKVKITRNNINKYKMQIKEYIENKAKKEHYYENSREFAEKIEYLTDNKIPVFLCNNNNSSTEITLSDTWDFNSKYKDNNNPYLVTVSTNNSKKDYYSPLSDIHEKATLELIETYDGGIDYTGDGIADVVDLSELENLKNINNFAGNSFAVAIALSRHLKAN